MNKERNFNKNNTVTENVMIEKANKERLGISYIAKCHKTAAKINLQYNPFTLLFWMITNSHMSHYI